MAFNDSKHELSITAKKSDDFPSWYQQVVLKAEMISYYGISGCYVLLPNSYSIWEVIKENIDREIKERGVRNCYFPLFITKKNLEREQDHIDDFSPEVAWVTRTGNNDLTTFEPRKYKRDIKYEIEKLLRNSEDDLLEGLKRVVNSSETRNEENYLAIRPTSECAIYSMLPSLINSHNDLPLKLNQWCNVVRWEFKDATPFIRSREFLWNEGHTCFSNRSDAIDEVKDIIRVYQEIYKRVLAVPTILGVKTEKEKFAGAEETYTVEAFISEVGRGVQGATSHCLGQNFSKMFDIKFQDKQSNASYVWQNSWGFTTRSIGVMLMTHGDDKGAVLPPLVANIQVVIVPIIFKSSIQSVTDYVEKVKTSLSPYFRVHVDNRDKNPGWKFNYWELRGIPLRIEVGPRDVDKWSLRICRRDTGNKEDIPFDPTFSTHIQKVGETLENIQNCLYEKAYLKLNNSVSKPTDWPNFLASIDNKKICLITWCGKTRCEEYIKEESGAKSLCIPVDKEYSLDINQGSKCLRCGDKATTHCLLGRSY